MWGKDDTNNPCSLLSQYIQLSPAIQRDLDQWTSTHSLLLATSSSLALLAGMRLGRASWGWKRITLASDITAKGPESPWLRGRVVGVSDGDTFRWYHQPTWFHSSLPLGKISETCLSIRICTIDTPEVAKFGQPSQPYGDAAKEYLTRMIADRSVAIKILTVDQYGRAVAEVRQGRLWRRYMDEQMLAAGLAEVYTGAGAVYGRKGKEAYLAMQAKAQAKKRGMWAESNRESAAEFKARMRASS